MIKDYVTLEQAKNHIMLDHNEDDAHVSLLIKAATAAIKNYLKNSNPFQFKTDDFGNAILDDGCMLTYLKDDNDNYIVRFEVVAATLILISEMYKNREAEQDGAISEGYGYLPRPVVALLYPLRNPALA